MLLDTRQGHTESSLLIFKRLMLCELALIWGLKDEDSLSQWSVQNISPLRVPGESYENIAKLREPYAE